MIAVLVMRETNPYRTRPIWACLFLKHLEEDTMSQHVFTTTHEGSAIEVLMGWDRPGQGFFMVVEKIDIDEKDDADLDDDAYIYTNLYDPELIENGGVSHNLDHFVKKLEELEIVVPEAILANVQADGEDNVGNKYVSYVYEGDQLIITSKPL